MMDRILLDRLRGELHFRAFERARLDYELKYLPERAAHADRAAKLMEMIRVEHRSYGRVEQLIRQVKAFNPSQPRDEQGRWTDRGGDELSDDGQDYANLFAEFPQQLLAMDITGFTKHGLNQAINRGVTPSAILDAINNPITTRSMPNGTTRYIGGRATVVINPNGSVVTVWPQ